VKPNPVNWFEISVSDMQRAIKFYGEAFGIKLEPVEIGPNTFAFFPMERGAAGAGGTKRFGGIGFLLNGNMLVGVRKDSQLVRLDSQPAEAALLEPHVSEFNVSGR
jgi:catechol 2,3-dioxygenase-like lactoylglutathione lyase family enzyme